MIKENPRHRGKRHPRSEPI